MTKREAKRQAYEIAAQLIPHYLDRDYHPDVDPSRVDDPKVDAALRELQCSLEDRADRLAERLARSAVAEGSGNDGPRARG